MNPTSAFEIAKLLGGIPTGIEPSAEATGWAWDSRDVKPGDIFLAIKGSRVDGHEHVAEASERGAIAALVERPVGVAHIRVSNLPTALARMASAYRERFSGPVIGVTGSAGKTMTKEFIAAAVAALGPVLKTQGNRNTEYTAPLLWTELTPEHKVVVVEMGMRGFGHIAHLANFSRPTIGVVTNIGYSHMELVGSREGIAKAKGEMLKSLPADGAAVLWNEDDLLDLLRSKTTARTLTFGIGETAECRVVDYRACGWTRCKVEGMLGSKTWKAELPAVGRHVALDAAAAVLASNCAGVDPCVAAAALANSSLPPMRMEVREWNGATLLVDVYNASPASMLAAIEALGEGEVAGRRIAVIGEMRELGGASQEGHREVGRALLRANVERVMLYGEGTIEVEEVLRAAGLPEQRIGRGENLSDVESFLRGEVRAGDVVLIKGSRALELERAVPT